MVEFEACMNGNKIQREREREREKERMSERLSIGYDNNHFTWGHDGFTT